MARPTLNLDEKQVENYAKLGASNRDIAEMLRCSEGTIRKRFPELLAKARATRKTMIRKYQWEAAKSGNVTMQIWLGKNELGQTDAQKIEHEGGLKIEVVYRKPVVANPDD